jgi:hypothetical protein
MSSWRLTCYRAWHGTAEMPRLPEETERPAFNHENCFMLTLSLGRGGTEPILACFQEHLQVSTVQTGPQ